MIRKFLDCSTSHVSKETAAWLDAQGRLAAAVDTDNDEHPAIHIGRLTTGWFFHADDDPDALRDDPSPPPQEVRDLMRHARRCGCDYVLLDQDGDKLDGLPVYEW